MKTKQALTSAWMSVWSVIGKAMFSKPFAYLAVAFVIYCLGGLTAHKVVDQVIHASSRGIEKCNDCLAGLGVAFRLDVPKATVVEESAPAETEDSMPMVLPELPLEEYGSPLYTLSDDEKSKAGGDAIQNLITGILPAVIQTESSGQVAVVGDKHLTNKAYGPLQVRQPVCDDIKRIFGVTIRPADCNGDPQLSEYAYRLYVGYWGAQYKKKTKTSPSAEVLVRIWNGGPDGHSKETTLVYLDKFMQNYGSAN